MLSIPLRSSICQLGSSLGLAALLSITNINPVLSQDQTRLTQDRLQRILTVTGQGEDKVEATEATVNLAVEAEGKTAEEVQSEVARRADAVVKFLQSQNVRNLQTTSITLNPSYDYSGGRQRIVGYRASNSVRFTIDADRSGPLIDQAIQTGASRIGGLSLKASDASVDQARTRALQDATRNARAQAEAVLSELGFREREIVGIQVNGAVPRPVPIARQSVAETAAAPPSSPVVAGEQTVRASVTLQIRY